MQDLATQWIQAYPCKNKTSQETQRSLQKFLDPERKPKVVYTDNSLEFRKTCEDLSWNHCTSPPHRSETNDIAERAVRRVKEGTSAVLLLSGLDENWWANSHGPRLYVCQAPNAFICVSSVAPPPPLTPNAFKCVSPNAFVCVSPNAFICVSPNASAESTTGLTSLAYLCSQQSKLEFLSEEHSCPNTDSCRVLDSCVNTDYCPNTDFCLNVD